MNDIEDFSKKANNAVMSNNKYPCNCSNKCCVCGGHNSNNPKKNKKNHSTWARLSHKLNSSFIRMIKGNK